MTKTSVRADMEPTILAVETALLSELAETMKACRAYADHLAGGGNPADVGAFRSPFRKAQPHAREIVNAYRRATGGVENPFPPTSGVPFRLFDFLAAREGEFVTNAEIQAAPIDRYGFQVEKHLPPYRLQRAGWRIEKGKVGGKVAYRLVPVPDEDGGER